MPSTHKILPINLDILETRHRTLVYFAVPEVDIYLAVKIVVSFSFSMGVSFKQTLCFSLSAVFYGPSAIARRTASALPNRLSSSSSGLRSPPPLVPPPEPDSCTSFSQQNQALSSRNCFDSRRNDQWCLAKKSAVNQGHGIAPSGQFCCSVKHKAFFHRVTIRCLYLEQATARCCQGSSWHLL